MSSRAHAPVGQYVTAEDVTPDIVTRVDRNLRFLYVSPAIERTTGLSPAHFIGKTHAEAGIPEPLSSQLEERLRHVFESGQDASVRFGFPNLTGEMHHYYGVGAPERDAQGVVETVVTVMRDVTAEFHAKETQQAVEQQLMLLVEASSALLASPNSQEVLRTIVGLAQRFVSADAYSVWGNDLSENWRILSSAGLTDEYMHTVVSARHARPLTSAIVAVDAAAEPALASRRDAYAREGIRSVLLIPLFVGKQSSGTVVFYWKQTHQITETEVRVAQALGNLAAAALGAAHLYERETQARERAQRSEQRSAFLAQAGAVLSSSLDYQTTLRNVAELAVPGFADWCSVDIVDEKGRIQQIVVQHVNPAMVQLAHQFREKYPVQEGELGRVVLRTGKAAMVETITPEMLEQGSPTPEYLDYVRKLGIASLIVVPICINKDSLGVMTLIRSKLDGPYSAEDLQTAEEIGRRAGTAIAHSRLYQNVYASEERLRLAVSAAGLGVWERDIKSGEITASEQGKINIGVNPGKPITYEDVAARVHKDDLESWNAAAQEASIEGGSFETEFRIWYPDATLHTVLAYGRALESEGGQIRKLIGITIDVTERRELLAREQEARRTAELLNSVGPALLSQLEIDKLVPDVTEIAAMLVGAHFGALVYHFSRAQGGGGSEVALSRAGTRMAGEDPEFELWLRSLPPDVAAEALEPGTAAARFVTFPYGQEPPARSGLRSFLLAPVKSRGGEVLGSLVLGHRATDAFNQRHVQIATGIAAQAAIALDNARLFEESRRARLALELSNMELRHVNEDLNQFAYSASHDLQEPLRMVAIYSQMLHRRYGEILDERGKQYLGYTLQGAKRMETLVKDLLAYTQAAASPDREIPLADTADMLGEALTNLETSIGESGACIQSTALPQLRILDLHLLQIFQNLIGNAIKYRKPDEKPEIRIYAECSGSMATIVVRDNGIGVPEQYRKHIFGLFRRLHSWDTYSGTGIGLAICQRLVERYGGKIWVESPAGGGAEFRFTLPCQ